MRAYNPVMMVPNPVDRSESGVAVEIERPAGRRSPTDGQDDAEGWEDGLDQDLLRDRRRARWHPSSLGATFKGLAQRSLARLGFRLVRLDRHDEPTGSTAAGALPAHLAELHHGAYGRPWCLGRDQADFLIDQGLEPGHRLLDFGCGSLRAGVWLAAHLDTGCYYGIDAHRPSLEAAARYEIPLHALEAKKPRLLHDSSFAVDHFGVDFDWIVAFSVFNHLTREQSAEATRRMTRQLAPGGRLVTSHQIPAEADVLALAGLELVHHEVRPCRLADDSIEWFVLRRREG